MQRKIGAIIMYLLIGGCSGFVVDEHIIGNYYLVAVDNYRDLGLSYCDATTGDGCIPIVNSTVFEVLYNKYFIFVKQHPHKAFSDAINKNITNYYILRINRNVGSDNKYKLLGPLDLNGFKNERKKLNISDSLKFTIIKKDIM